MMKSYSILFLPLFLAAVAAGTLSAQSVATGFVYHDADGDGSRGEEESGIGEVLVSNGREVVKTDAAGAWSLPVGEDTILFVIQPKGWQVPVNEFNLPQFHYIHKPAGSPPELKYPGVAPTGPLPESIEFPLYPSETGEAFSIFAFGDPQPYSEEDVDYFREDVVEEAMQVAGPVAGVTLGDVVGDDLDLFQSVNAVTALMNRPWWHVYGNHDMNFGVADDETADETFERVYGPPTYAFQIGDVVFIALDNVLFPNHVTDSRYTGYFTEKQLAFVGNLLAYVPEENLVVSMMHIPLYDEDPWDSFVDESREAFFALFAKHRHTLSLSAHTHTQNHHFFDHDHDHWPHVDAPHHHYNVGTTSGSWWRGAKDERGIPDTTMRDGTPNGYAILEFNGNRYSYEYRVAGADKDYQMSIFAPRTVNRIGWGYAAIAVNFFNGSEQATVEMRVDEGDWRTLRHTRAPDPGYTLNRLQRDRMSAPPAGKALPYPADSSHLWTGRLPTNLEPGIHRVDVRVTDRFGRIFEDSTSYRIVENP